MFQLSRNFCEWIKSKTDMQMSVLLTGLNNAGKSTILSCIRGGKRDAALSMGSPGVGLSHTLSPEDRAALTTLPVAAPFLATTPSPHPPSSP